MSTAQIKRADATRAPLGRSLMIATRDAAIIAAACAILALVTNQWWHPEGIPLFAQQAYETLVPCPVSGGKVQAVQPDDPELQGDTTFLVDARPADRFESWHRDGALNIPYDYLEPTPKATLDKLSRQIASSRAQRVVVCGDGDNPDTGELLAQEISLSGIKNVFFVEGGAPALRAHEDAQQ
jgi:rhodanese-related sulfurtransferase